MPTWVYFTSCEYATHLSVQLISIAWQVETDLRGITGKGKKVQYLKDAICIRVVGFGWREFKVTWQPSGENTDSQIKRLTAHLKEIIKAEKGSKKNDIPTEAHTPQLERKSLKQLGTPTAQLEELDAKAAVSVEEFRAAVDAERKRREAEGRGDMYEVGQPPSPPTVNSRLVNKHVEVCYSITHDDDGSTELFWFPGTVEQVSDGSVPKGGRSQAKWEAGFARIAFDAQPLLGEHTGTESWVKLNSSKWNRAVQNGWRLDLDFPDDVRAVAGGAGGTARAR